MQNVLPSSTPVPTVTRHVTDQPPSPFTLRPSIWSGTFVQDVSVGERTIPPRDINNSHRHIVWWDFTSTNFVVGKLYITKDTQSLRPHRLDVGDEVPEGDRH